MTDNNTFNDQIYNWGASKKFEDIKILDEILRDGTQTAGVRAPDEESQKTIIDHINRLNLDAVNIGMPAASTTAYDKSKGLFDYITTLQQPPLPYFLARIEPGDIETINKITVGTDQPFRIILFVGISEVRRKTEGWSMSTILDKIKKSVTAAKETGAQVVFATEDTTRAQPKILETTYRHAIKAGADRICVCDTVGCATPDGIKEIITFITDAIKDNTIPVEFHGHNDRGLALANSLAAYRAGAKMVHACPLGLGERAGNTALEALLVNVEKMGVDKFNLDNIMPYIRYVSEVYDYPIPTHHPVVGDDVYTTGTGIHVAAINKAQKQYGQQAANRIYCSVPIEKINRERNITISYHSGKANVKAVLNDLDIPAKPDIVTALLKAANQSDTPLGEKEVRKIVRQVEGKDDTE